MNDRNRIALFIAIDEQEKRQRARNDKADREREQDTKNFVGMWLILAFIFIGLPLLGITL